jgi:histidyl-tRNA synthetase
LDYYNRTAFEFVTDQLGAQGTVLAGGRYDGLVESLGGPATTAVGFAAGMERLAMLMPDIEAHAVDVVVVALGDDVLSYSLQVAKQLREQGIAVVHAGGGAAKRQFKLADREGARFVAVMGDDEVQQGVVALKNLATGEQRKCSLEQVVETFIH